MTTLPGAGEPGPQGATVPDAAGGAGEGGPELRAGRQDTPLRVLVPRGGAPGARLAEAVRAAGHEPVLAPLITFEPPSDPAALEAAVRDLCDGEFDWLVLTSERTVEALAALPAFDELLCTEVHVAAVGPTTATRAEELGLETDVLPETDRTARGLVAELTRLRPAIALVPHSDLAGPELADGLRAADWQVREVVAYRTRTATTLPEGALPIDAVLLTSGSTARTWAALRPVPTSESEPWSTPGPGPASDSEPWSTETPPPLGIRDPAAGERAAGEPATGAAGKPAAGAADAIVVCIGPRTAEAAEAAGLSVAAVAAAPDPQALVAALTHVLPARSRP